MNTFELTKIMGGLCGSLLILLLLKWGSEIVYHEHHSKIEAAYLIETGTDEEEIVVEEEQIPFLQLLAEADVKKGKKVFGKCKACHKLEPGVNGTGPYLHAIVGRTIASVAEFKYSNVFNNMEGVWSEDELNAFLLKPSDYAPGTKMSYSGLKNVTDRANLIAYLKTIKD